MSSSNGMTGLREGMDRRMHIAMYIGSLQRGGAERVMVNLATYLLQRGWRVTFVTTFTEEGGYPLPEGAERILSGLTPEEEGANRLQNIRKRIRKLTGIWESLQPDLILSFMHKNNVMALQTTRHMEIPVVVSVRADPAMEFEDPRIRFLMRLTFPQAAGIVLQTAAAADYFPAGIRKKCTVLPNMLQEAFVDMPVAEKRSHRVVMVGRLDENKNQAAVVKAFAQTAEEFPDWTLTLYGDGPDRERLLRLIRELRQETRVFVPGPVEEVAQAIADARIFVLYSSQEGMPNALLEAMSLGLACISTDCPVGVPREIIRDAENGFLVPLNDADSLLRTLRTLMRDEAVSERVGRQAVQVRETYAPERVCAMWERYLEEAIDAV